MGSTEEAQGICNRLNKIHNRVACLIESNSIAIGALNEIAWGTEDSDPPFKAMSRSRMKEIAGHALEKMDEAKNK